MSKPTNAPACFAAASVFSHDSEICQQCCAFEQCASASLETLEAIKGIVNVQDLLKRHAVARKVAQGAMKQADEKLKAEMSPGNIKQPLMKPVERKTRVVQVRFEISADEEHVIAMLPVKPQKVALSLCKTGMLERIKKGVAEGHNALVETGPEWLRVALSSLLAGGFSKSELRESLQSELGWTEGTAASHVSMASVLILAFGIGQPKDGRIVLSPTTGV
jgi:hypothetical protein